MSLVRGSRVWGVERPRQVAPHHEGLADRVDDWLDKVAQGTVEKLGPEQRKRWWVFLALGIVIMAAGGAAISALEGNLRAMHVAGALGFTLGPILRNANLPEATRTWARFSATANQFADPEGMVDFILILDWLLYIPGYTLGALALLLHEYRVPAESRRSGQQHKPLLRWAAALTVGLALIDAGLENVLQLYLVHHYWRVNAGLAPTDPTPRQGALDTLLFIASDIKWVLAAAVLLAVVLVLVVRAVEISAESRRSLRLLRSQVFVAVLALLAFSIPIQLADVLLRMDRLRALLLGAVVLLFAVSLWGMGNLLVTAREIRAGTSPRGEHFPPWLLVVPAIALGGLAAVNHARHANWEAPLVPVALVAIIWILGFPVRSEQKSPSRRQALPLKFGAPGMAGKVLPSVLGAVGVLAVGLATLRAGMGLYVQGGGAPGLRSDHGATFPIAVGAVLIASSLGLLLLGERLARRRVERVERVAPEKAETASPEQVEAKEAFRTFAWVTGAAALVTTGIMSLEISDAVIWGPRLGGAAIAVLFLTGAALALGAMVMAGEWWVAHHDAPALFRALHLRTIPVFWLLAVWAVVATLTDNGTHWDVDLKAAEAMPGFSLQTAFDNWEHAATQRAKAAGRKSVPLVLVATSGGGIRAAYWTALTLDCVINSHQAEAIRTAALTRKSPCGDGSPASSPGDIFLATGISGSSLGLLEWDLNTASGSKGDWVQSRLGQDFVAPTVAQGLLVEVARSFLGYAARGRAQVLEQAWERPWSGAVPSMSAGFLESQKKRLTSGGPLLMLEGSSVFDGCALNTSILNVGSTIPQTEGTPAPQPTGDTIPIGDCTSTKRYLERSGSTPVTAAAAVDPGPLPGTIDLVDYLACQNKDVKLSTAALLSARFPFVSPSGRLPGCSVSSPSTKFILDGGIVDDSGAESTMSIWAAIEPLVRQRNADTTKPPIVPYFLQIDNSYLPATSPPGKTKPPNQLLAPLQAVRQSAGDASRATRARALAADTFTLPFQAGAMTVAGRYMTIEPHDHPGIEAPLGWTLANGSQTDLETELYRDNATSISAVRCWLTKDPQKCVP